MILIKEIILISDLDIYLVFYPVPIVPTTKTRQYMVVAQQVTLFRSATGSNYLE